MKRAVSKNFLTFETASNIVFRTTELAPGANHLLAAGGAVAVTVT